MEAATTKQATPPLEGVSSFAKSLFLGEIHDELVFPYPKPAEGEQDRIRSLIASLRELAAESIDPRRIEEDGMGRGRPDPRARRARPVWPVRAGALRRAGPLPDRLLPGVRGPRADRPDPVGRDGRAPVDRHEGNRAVRKRRAEGALPPRPRRRAQACGLRAHGARGGLGRVQPAVAGDPAARRLLEAERREAVHRQRRQGIRARHLRPHRGGRQGPPHGLHRREGHGGVRGRAPLRDDGPARQRPAPPVLQGRSDPARERPGRARRWASGSPCTS